MTEDYIRFDPAKLRSVVHFICARCQPDELGNMKLHKILYFADMMKFVSSGQPLTGVDYIKQQFGPTARHLTSALNELGKQGFVHVETLDYFGFEKKRYISLVEPDTSIFSNEDIQLLADQISTAIKHLPWSHIGHTEAVAIKKPPEGGLISL